MLWQNYYQKNILICVSFQLREMIWDPVEPHLGDAGQVFVVPDGALHLVSLAALRASGLPKGLNILGFLVGTVGIISILPRLTDLTGVFGLSQIVWFVWLGIVLLRSNSSKTT